MEFLFTPEALLSLLTITFLEIVLGIDNIIFITIAANKLPENQQPKALNIGLVLAMVLRLVMLLGITYIYKLSEELFSFSLFGQHASVNGHSLILFIGGLFLLYKSTTEIHHKLEGPTLEEEKTMAQKVSATMNQIIFQIAMINVVFSFDSILTAVGLTDNIPIMMIAVVISVLVMLVFAGPVGRFVNEHPSIQMLGLAFLILIGFMLIAEGAHLAQLIEGAVPKGYLYFAIFFSLAVEFLNMKLRKSSRKPVVLKQHLEDELNG